MSSRHDSRDRVVVTGFGIRAAIEPIDDVFAMLERGEHYVASRELAHDGEAVRYVGAACAKDPPLPYLTQRKWLKYMGYATQFSVWAAGRALQDAGLWNTDPSSSVIREAMSLWVATGPIAFELSDVLPGLLVSRKPNSELDFAAMGTVGLRHSSPMMPFHTLLNMPVGLISMVFGLKGQNAILYPDADQSLAAFSLAVRAIQNARADIALVGGTANLVSLMPIVSYAQRASLADSPESATPFLGGHRGLAVGDAAAMVVLESERHARARGARVYGALTVEPMSLEAAELSEIRNGQKRPVDLILATGTWNDEQDAWVAALDARGGCLSLDAVEGYTATASIALHLAAACRLFQRPEVYLGGHWHAGGSIELLSCVSRPVGSRWGRLRLDSAS